MIVLIPTLLILAKAFDFSAVSMFKPSAAFNDQPFRSLDGVGNNRKKPELGSSFTNKIRIAPTQEGVGDLIGGATVLSRDMICRCAKKRISRPCIRAFHTACNVDDSLPFCQNTQNKSDPVTLAKIRKGFREWCKNPQELTGFGLPSPRVISNALFDQPANTPQSEYGQTSWVWAWGQFMDHDTAAETDLGNDEMVTFCKRADHAAAKAQFPNLSEVQQRSSCFQPIEICCKNLPPNDPRQDKFFNPNEPLDFFRSPYNLDSKNRREYLNIITSFIDGSQIYGSSKTFSDFIRDLSDDGHGRLRTDPTGKFAFVVNEPVGRSATRFTFGDLRGNENRILTLIHTLFLREHNRLAEGIWTKMGKPACNRACNDRIFQRARAYVVGLLQKITYEDWLPEFLGPEFAKTFIGKYKGYNSKVDPSLTMEFTVAGFRVGHTMLNEELLRANRKFEPIGTPLKLANAFQQDAQTLVDNPDEMRELLLGLGAQRSERVDEKFVSAVRNMLFGNPQIGQQAFDLPALNLQRSRDNGVARINEVRRRIYTGNAYVSPRGFCRPYTQWDKLVKNQKIKKALREELYHSFKLDIVELFVGGVLEDHFRAPGADARMGETFAFINAEQFRRLRDGDRFWYERYLPKKLVNQIKADSLAKVLERNLNVNLKLKQRNVFKVQPTSSKTVSANIQEEQEQEQELDVAMSSTMGIDQVDVTQTAQEVQSAPVVQSTSGMSIPVLVGGALIGVGMLGFYFRTKSDDAYESAL